MAVYCPVCESPVEAVAKVCLSCSNDLTQNGPITASGHDVRQLKAVIRARDDLSMADKFSLIAQIEEGADPVELGIAAAAGEEPAEADDEAAPADADAGAPAVATGAGATAAAADVDISNVDLTTDAFQSAFDAGFAASQHVHEIAIGEAEGDPALMAAIPVLRPPTKAFCPKCGSDIHSYSQMQYTRWRDEAGAVVAMQLEAGLQSALAHMQARHDAEIAAAVEAAANDEELRASIAAELRPQIEEELNSVGRARGGASRASRGGSVASKPAAAKPAAATPAAAKPAAASGKAAASSSGDDGADEPLKASPGGSSKPAGGGDGGPKLSAAQMMFGGGGGKKKTYEGEPEGKPDWFLAEALDTVYDPHGTGKKLTPKTILARSADGNVRVQDVVRIFDAEGEEALSELAWTSPFTKYIIEAYAAS